MSYRLGLLLVLATPTMLVAQGDDAAKTELKKLQGLWTVVSMEIDGMGKDLSKAPRLSFEIKDDKIKQMVGDKVVMSGTILVNPGANPKHLDVIAAEGENKGKKDMAIYEFDGESLKVAGYTGESSLSKRLDAFPKSPTPMVDRYVMKKVVK